jgi:TetR/AcrR family transcriptional regulator
VARTRSATYDDQREMILARAAELFSKRGYPATSMNQLAEACGLSKPTLYHYYRDKYALLVQIAEGHVVRLRDLVRAVETQGLPAEARLRELILRFVEEYAHAQHAHRVLTEDVRFLVADDRARVLVIEREVVDGFARTLVELRPEFDTAHLATPVSMLLFGMINWMFTWLKPDGRLSHDAMAPVVADLFFGGLSQIRIPPAVSP